MTKITTFQRDNNATNTTRATIATTKNAATNVTTEQKMRQILFTCVAGASLDDTVVLAAAVGGQGGHGGGRGCTNTTKSHKLIAGKVARQKVDFSPFRLSV